MSTQPNVQTQTLELPDVDLVHDVRGPLPTADGRPPLLMIGQPMCADGFEALAAEFPDRTVVTYDPRGLGRSSTRRDGREDQTPEIQAADLHALVEHLDAGPVDVFASSGGAVTALTWASTHPGDLATVVAHEPPAVWALPDADAASRGFARVRQTYADKGFGAGMAEFIAFTSGQGEITEEYFAQPAADPAMFGLPTEDDGSRDDPLLSERSVTVTSTRPDLEALRSGSPRIVMAVGEETGDAITARTTRAVADALGLQVTMFPSHHGGFASAEGPWPGKSVQFGARLKEVLADDADDR
ncbi:hydrolase [Knoellia sinensis KCTC 19936]|uniref:Hydrolase n=1 Tax=Knoellia sinensis KCTC 19936 TaxID=1385520 RepID=A0A0A0J0Y9_9MICO|nr:alpha/beta fold hydrolase [Knoellia sinensis]KGN31030.1 hydrolase [Knoellia sinensis KCTC 19936]